MILDLTVFEEETLDIKLAQDRVVHVRKPSQRMVIEMLKLKDLKAGDEQEALKQINQMVCKILNDNTDGVTFTQADVQALAIKSKSAIVTAYSKFAAEIQANPT